MVDSTRLFLFLFAAVLLAVAPGPGLLYVLARTLAGGKREGVLSAVGTFAGGMVHVLAAALGISIILARSALVFEIVRGLGAAYLFVLGLRMILSAHKEQAQEASTLLHGNSALSVSRSRYPLWQGIATEVLNPKTALFFLSFIPQFVNRGTGHVFLQFALLGTISVSLNTTADFFVIMMAGPLGNRIRSSARFRRRQRTATGAIMVGLGAYLLIGDRS